MKILIIMTIMITMKRITIAIFLPLAWTTITNNTTNNNEAACPTPYTPKWCDPQLHAD